MYKTISHGGLQYTILPQNDDFRIDGKLTSAESTCSSSGSSNNGRKSKTKRPRRRSFFAYLGLIFVCTVIVGAVLIPFLVSAECLPNPTDWFLGKNAPNHEKPKSIAGIKGHGNGATAFNGAHSSFIGSGINIGKTVKIINQAGIEKVVLRVNKTKNNVTENSKSNKIPKMENKVETIDEQKYPADNKAPMVNVQSNAQILNTNQNSAQDSLQPKNAESGVAQQMQMQSQSQSQITISDKTKQNLNGNFANNPPNEHFVTEVRFEPVETVSSKPPGIIPTIVVTTLRNQLPNNEPSVQQFPPQQQQFTIQSQTAPNVRPTNTFLNSASVVNNGSYSITPTSTLLTRIIQVPLLKAAAKKPIIPPVLVKTKSQFTIGNGPTSIENANPALTTVKPGLTPQQSVATSSIQNSNSAETVVESAKTNDWIHAHWPFIDPSTYFQWTGYKAEDSVLLPALLGFALIGMILIITVCLVARNKRTIVSSVRKRNRNVSDVEENGAEDNTTLLTTANLSDED